MQPPAAPRAERGEDPAPGPSSRAAEAAGRPRSFALPAAAAALALVTCALLAPVVVNGDGLGYLRAAPAGELVPGHLAWLPLLRLLARLALPTDPAALVPAPLALLPVARAACWVAAALAAATFADAAARLAGQGAAVVATLGLCGSYGFLQAGADVEAYAPALAALCAALACAARRSTGGGPGWLPAAGLLAGLAALLHIENVLFIPVAALLAARRPAGGAQAGRLRPVDALAVAAAAGLLVLGSYLALFVARGDDPASAVRWLRGASHGFRYPLRFYAPGVALYGAARSLVLAPYPIEAGWAQVIGLTTVGVAVVGALAWLASRPGRPAVLGAPAGLAWALPYGAVGVLFFASDNERWIFLLPAAWLLAGAGAATSASRLRLGLAMGAALLLLSIALGLPRARDDGRRQLADQAAARMAAGDLVVSPGHGWDEYVGFYAPLAVEPFPMVYYCGLLGDAGAMATELAGRAARARAAGHQVWLLRGDDDGGREGWKDLALFGVTPDSAAGLLPGRRVAVAPGIERLEVAAGLPLSRPPASPR